MERINLSAVDCAHGVPLNVSCGACKPSGRLILQAFYAPNNGGRVTVVMPGGYVMESFSVDEATAFLRVLQDAVVVHDYIGRRGGVVVRDAVSRIELIMPRGIVNDFIEAVSAALDVPRRAAALVADGWRVSAFDAVGADGTPPSGLRPATSPERGGSVA